MCGGGFLHDLGTLYRFLSHVISRVRVTWFVFLGGGGGEGWVGVLLFLYFVISHGGSELGVVVYIYYHLSLLHSLSNFVMRK